MTEASRMDTQPWIALDIGGANIKFAHAEGAARTVPFEVWKRPDELADVLAAVAGTMPRSDCAAVTMTAELCDCYPTKTIGVNAVLDAVAAGLSGRLTAIWGVDGEFHSASEIRRQPLMAAAANWLALATVAARLIPDRRGLLIDIGTTTTDLIPLAAGSVSARGRSDTERLQTGELVYAGVRRTPVCALAAELPLRGTPTGLAAEIFASTLDVYLTLGEIAPNPVDLDTADGRPATVDSARDRLARMVCADRDLISAADALALAQVADAALIERLARAADRACGPTIGQVEAAVVAGSGEFLARKLAHKLCKQDGLIISLKEAWGPLASSAGCAYALLELAKERLQREGPFLRDVHSGRLLRNDAT